MFNRTITRAAAWSIPFVLTAVAIAADAHGTPVPHAAVEEHGDASVVSVNPFQFVAAILVFVVSLGILSKTAWPKILDALDARDTKIREDISAAEEAKEKANEAMAEYEKSLAEARAEAAAMLEKTKAEQTRMAADLKQQAEIELNELRDDARRNIEAAKRAALTEIYTEAADIATAVAQRILEREVNAADQQRLVEESIAEFTQDFAKSGAAN